MFKGVAENAETDRIKAQLKWLAAQLGPARNFDVVVAEGVTPLRKHNPATPELRLLETDLKKRRDEGFARAKAAVESERCRRIVLDTALWLIDGKWSRGARFARRAQPIARFAREVLRARTRKIVKKGREIESLYPRRRHKLSIGVKKLRYASAFFASLFDDTKLKKSRKLFEKDLKALQSALGKQRHRGASRPRADIRASAAPNPLCPPGYLPGRNLRPIGSFFDKLRMFIDQTGEVLGRPTISFEIEKFRVTQFTPLAGADMS